MSEKDTNIPPVSNALEIPPFGGSPGLRLEMGKIREAESRFLEAKTVNPSSYIELESCLNESYRDLKRHLSTIGYQITLAEKAIRQAKAEVLLGSYTEFMKGKPKSHDNADLRDAYLIKDEAYSAALDRLNQLKALFSNFDGKIKVVENVCRYMRQKMYLISKNGAVDPNLYVTSEKK